MKQSVITTSQKSIPDRENPASGLFTLLVRKSKETSIYVENMRTNSENKEKHLAAITSLALIIGFAICCGCIDQISATSFNPYQVAGNSSIITIMDIKERNLTFSGPVHRIICQSSDAAVFLMVIGAGNDIVGVPESTLSYPYQRNLVPDAVSIGESSAPDVEKIIALHPDVVILMTSSNPQIAEKLHAARIPYLYIDGYRLLEIPREVRILGLLTNRSEKAEQYVSFYSQYLHLVDERLSSVPDAERPRVYFEGNSAYSTVGKTSGGDSLIQMAYGKNIGRNLDVPWPVVSPEWVMSQDPQVIIKIAYPSTLNNSTMSGIFDNVIMRPSLNSTSAGRNGRVYVLHHRVTYNAQGIASLVYLVKAMYPEQFTDIDPDEILLEYDREFLPGSYIENSFYPKFWKNQSGFSPKK